MTTRRVVALDIGGTKIAAALVELGGEQPVLTHRVQAPTEALKGGEHVLVTALDVIASVISEAGHVEGVGISSAGVVNPRTGDIVYANELMPGWGGTPLASEVTKRFQVPCTVLNDVHAHALGEARHGAGKNAASSLVVAVGTGIGGAVVLNGKLMLGAHDEAGHIGHVCCPAAVGVDCPCGGTAHLEPVASGPGILNEYKRLTGLVDINFDGAEVDRRALAGDVHAQTAEARAGRALGEVLGSQCNMIDPACIILSGSVAQCSHFWSDALKEAFTEQAMPPVASTPINSGELGGDAPLIGAAENFILSGYADHELATSHS